MNPILASSIREARRSSWDETRHVCGRQLAFYEGDYLNYFIEYMRPKISDKAWNQWKSRKFWNELENVMADVVNKTTKVYKRDAYRAYQIEQGEEIIDDEVFEDILTHNLMFSYDHQMDLALRMALIGANPFIRMYVEPDSLDKLRCQILTGDQVIAMRRNGDCELTGIHYILFNEQYSDSLSADVVQREYVFDTGDGAFMAEATGGRIREPGYAEIDSRGDVDLSKSLLGASYPYYYPDGRMVMPYTGIRVFANPGEYFNPTLGNDLYWGTLLATWYSIQKEWIIRNQSHKQFVLAGPQVNEYVDQLIDPTSPLIFPNIDGGEASVTILDLKTDPAHIEAAIDKIYERLLTRRGMSLESFRSSVQRQTAEAQRIQREGEQDYQLSLIRDIRPIEIAVMDKTRIIWNAHNREQINMDAEAVFDPSDPYESDPWANWQEKKDAVSLNVLTGVDLMMDLNKDLTREQAEKQFAVNRQINGRTKVSFGGGAAQAVAGNAPPPNNQQLPPLPGQPARTQPETQEGENGNRQGA